MKYLFKLLSPYKKAASIALFFMLAELFVELFQPLLMSRIINDGIERMDLQSTMILGGFMVLLAFVGFACGIINSFYAARVSQGYGFDLRKQLFQKIQSFSFANFNQFPTSTLITRVTSDVNILQQFVFMGLRIMMRAPLMMIGGLIMAFIIDAKLALILGVVIPLLLVFLIWSMTRAYRLFSSVQRRLDHTNGVLRENLLGIRLIKAFVSFRQEIRRFTQSNEQLMERTVAALRIIELTVPLLLLAMNLSILFILWSGHLEVIGGGSNVGDVVAVVNYTTRITGAFSAISMVIMNISRAKASANRISEVMEEKVDIYDTEDSNANLQITSGHIAFKQVNFSYSENTLPILESISFTVNPGQTVAIMGATGSGKSSLFQLIPRLYDVKSGSVQIDHTDVRKMKLDVLRKQIGFVPQDPTLFTGTVRENIMWGKEDATMEEVIEAARHAQLHDTIMKLPLQYETVVGQKGVNLSGGQKQRMSIARALIRKPAILLLDDSTSALDLQTEAKLLAAIATYACTTLIITQKISTAMHADMTLLLDNGQLIAQGNHEQLLHNSELYKQIVTSQFGKEGVPHV